MDVVRALHDAGYNVLATASDQGPTNQEAVAEPKSSTKDEIFYEINGRMMVHIWDIPHVLKNVRNNFLSSDIQHKDRMVAEGRHLIEHIKLDKSLCKLSSITNEHIAPDALENNWLKMLHKDDVLDKVVQFFEEIVSFFSVTCLQHALDFKTQFPLMTALYLLDRKRKRINSSKKKGVFSRTRQVTYSCKKVDGLRVEDKNHQLADSDLSLLDGSQKFMRPQKC
ncbi:hypothetical protein ONE63_003397 [Megalurothrips usitatus]|uniref:Transposable element P transposase n=1 Tax=Megalurothrips usitatus TaxID=439358 RepID=A0AAV7XAP5_9NEOP|nr:hypothetical protein ONE63_003397 [Megalurothrips usitatus]